MFYNRGSHFSPCGPRRPTPKGKSPEISPKPLNTCYNTTVYKLFMAF